FEDAVVARPTESLQEILRTFRVPDDQADGPSPLSETCDSDRVDDLAAAGEVEERFQCEGVGTHRIRRLRPFRMEDCGFQVIPPKNNSGVDREDLPTAGLRPIPEGTNGRLSILDGAAGSQDLVAHPKSPRAACPSTSRTSTGAPTCSLIFTASDGPIVGIRERSFGFAFWRSRRVRNPRWNRARPRTRPTPRREISSSSSSITPYCTRVVSRVKARTFFLLKIRPSSAIEYRSHSPWSVIRRMSPGP